MLILIAAGDAIAYFYENNYFGSQPHAPSPTPAVPSAPPKPTAAPPPTALPSSVTVSNLFINPIEAWPNQTITVSVEVRNRGSGNISYLFPFSVNGAIVQSVPIQMAGGTILNVTALLNESAVGSYNLNGGGQANTFNVVPTGMHTLNVIMNIPGIKFSLDGVSYTAGFSGLVPVGTHTITVPASQQVESSEWGLVTYGFSGWNGGSTSLTQAFDVEGLTYEVGNYARTAPTSCPELYAWNGTGYSYAADVNDGTGWLGFLEYFNPDGSMVFSYNYPYDYIKLDSTQLQPLNGFYNMQIAEDTNEIFYLDSVKLLAVDHPAGTDVFSTKSTFVNDLSGQGTIYSLNNHFSTPVSAINGEGQNVLPQVSKLDGVFTTANRWTWNNLTLNLGNLSGATNIDLVVAARTEWPSTSAGGENFMSYANKPGVMPSPPPYMQVMAANGSWVNVPENREFPIPATTDQTFDVNLTGLFPTNNFMLRINYYQLFQFDYIGVSTSPQQDMNVYTLTPSSAVLSQAYGSNSTSSGAFTKYGDVTSLEQSTDNQFVIGRQGDVVSIQFLADLPPVPKGWVRDYFVVANCWFKGNGLPYVPFTVNPLPFQTMTSFPYPSSETYPQDSQHQTYLKTYNTRIIK